MDFPQRDEDGRVVRLIDLLAILLAGIFVGLIAVVLIDWTFATFGAGQFGRSSGWLAAVLPFLVLLDEFRAWRPVRGRIALAVGAAVVAFVLGTLAHGVASYLPRTLAGAVGATVAVLVYGVLWFYGVRRLR